MSFRSNITAWEKKDELLPLLLRIKNMCIDIYGIPFFQFENNFNSSHACDLPKGTVCGVQHGKIRLLFMSIIYCIML